MKKSVKGLTLALALLMVICLSNTGYAAFYNDPGGPNYYLPNLMLDLRFNGDTLDYSGNQNNGTPIGTTQYVTSINNNGLNFGGANYVTINNSPSLNLGTGSFSLALWFKTNSDQNNVMIDKRDVSHDYQGYCLTLYYGVPLLQLGDGNAYYNFWPGYNAPTYYDNQWHFLSASVTRNGSTVAVIMYVDGAVAYQGSIGQIGSITNSIPLYIGMNVDGSGDFIGALDDVAIFNAPLTAPCYHSPDYQPQICRYQLYTSTDLDLTFDNTTGDSSRYQNTTTYYGGSPVYLAGMNQNGISLNGSQYVDVTNSNSLNFGTGDFSIACWFKTASTQIINPILDKRSSSYQGYCLLLYNGIPMLQINDQNGYYDFWPGANGPAFKDNQWHFITVSVARAGTTGLKFYVDGNLIYTGNPTAKSGSITNTSDLLIGKDNNGDYFNGCLDELYLFNLALPGNLAEEFNPPAPPVLVSAQPGDGRVSLLWNTVVGATSYQVMRSTTSNGTFTAIATGLTGTTYTDTGLTDGTTYYYEVIALPCGANNPSNVLGATPQGAVYPWAAMANLPDSIYYAQAVTINGYIYAMGFLYNSYNYPIYQYDPNTNTWTENTVLQGIYGWEAVAYNGKIYFIGGTDQNGNALTSVQEYNPVTGSLVAKAWHANRAH